MNSKSIILFNYIYSSIYDRDKSDAVKWEEFEKLCLNKMNYVAYDFIIENAELVNVNENGMWHDICGNRGIDGKFVILTLLGQIKYIDYKINEIKAIINNYGREAFKNLDNVFDCMCNEAIKDVLLECRNRGLIEFNDNIFIYASNRLYNIFFDGIKIVINNKNNNMYGNNIIINNGNFVSQLGNENVVNIGLDDEKLFELLDGKFELIKMEMKNSNCEDKLLELETAIKKKDKKSALSILSELASIGSFIVPTILKMCGITN